MKAARTYVFVFIPILFDRLTHTRVTVGLRAGSNGSFAPDQKHDEKPRWRVRQRDGCQTQPLRHDLFWTWFIDNPRPQLSK